MAKTPPGPNPGRHSLSNQLREIILARRIPAAALAVQCDVNRRMIDRFLSGSRTLTLATADRIAAGLGLRLAEGPGRKAPRSLEGKPSRVLDGRTVFEVVRGAAGQGDAPDGIAGPDDMGAAD